MGGVALDVTGAPGVSDGLKWELCNIVGDVVGVVVRLVDLADLFQVGGGRVVGGVVVDVVGLGGGGRKVGDGGHGAGSPWGFWCECGTLLAAVGWKSVLPALMGGGGLLPPASAVAPGLCARGRFFLSFLRTPTSTQWKFNDPDFPEF